MPRMADLDGNYLFEEYNIDDEKTDSKLADE